KGLTINGAIAPLDSVQAFPDDVPDATVLAVPPGGNFQVTYPFSSGDYGLVAPSAWGVRRAPGRLQVNLSDLLRAEAKLKQSVVKYDLLLQQIQDTLNLLQAQYDLNADKIAAKSLEFATLATMTAVQTAAKGASITAKRYAAIAKSAGKDVMESLPTVVGAATDVFAPVRGSIIWAG